MLLAVAAAGRGRRPQAVAAAGRGRRGSWSSLAEPHSRAPAEAPGSGRSTLIVLSMSTPRTCGRALRVACRCAGSPTSSVVAPTRRRFAPGTVGRWGAVELAGGRSTGTRSGGGSQSAGGQRPRAATTGAPGRARLARVALEGGTRNGGAQDGGGPGRRRPRGPGRQAHHDRVSSAPRSASRSSSDGRPRSGSSPGVRSGSAGRTSRARDRVLRPARARTDDAMRRPAALEHGAVSGTTVGVLAQARTGGPRALGRAREPIDPARPAARRDAGRGSGRSTAARRPADGRRGSAESRSARPPPAAGGERGRAGARRPAPLGQGRAERERSARPAPGSDREAGAASRGVAADATGRGSRSP